MTTDQIPGMLRPPIVAMNISLQLLDVKCISFELSAYGTSSTDLLKVDDYEFTFNVSCNVDDNTQHASVSSFIKLMDKRDPNDKKEIGEIKSQTIFLIANYNEIIKKDEKGQILLPQQLVQFCNGIHLNNTRGMLVVKLENTRYSNALLPLLDLNLLVPIPSARL